MKKMYAWGLTLAATMMASVVLADTIEAAIGNTVVVSYADGAVVRYHFNADHSFNARWSDGEINGSWALQGE